MLLAISLTLFFALFHSITTQIFTDEVNDRVYWYQPTSRQVNFYDAVNECRALGGALLMPRSPAQIQWLAANIDHRRRDFWVGVTPSSDNHPTHYLDGSAIAPSVKATVTSVPTARACWAASVSFDQRAAGYLKIATRSCGAFGWAFVVCEFEKGESRELIERLLKINGTLNENVLEVNNLRVAVGSSEKVAVDEQLSVAERELKEVDGLLKEKRETLEHLSDELKNEKVRNDKIREQLGGGE